MFARSAEGTRSLWNEAEEGFAEVRSITFDCSGGLVVTAAGKWTAVLTGTVHPLTLTWAAIEARVSVRGVDYGTFAGPTVATYGDSDPEEGNNVEGYGDELDTEVKFRARLPGADGSSLAIAGQYHFAPNKGEGATAELQPCNMASCRPAASLLRSPLLAG